MKKTRGFTLVELAIVISISALVTPLAFMAVRTLLDNFARARFDLEVARSARTVSEELQLDLRRMKLLAGPSVSFEGQGDCAKATWGVTEDGALARTPAAGCGEPRVLARHVARVEAMPQGVSVTFALPLRTDLSYEVPVFIGAAP